MSLLLQSSRICGIESPSALAGGKLQRIPRKSCLSKTSAEDAHDLAKYHEIGSFLDCVELLYSAALIRKESRGLHIREDYPFRDDVNWLKWIMVYKDETGQRVRTVPVPMYRYPVKIGKYEKIPLPVPLPKIEA